MQAPVSRQLCWWYKPHACLTTGQAAVGMTFRLPTNNMRTVAWITKCPWPPVLTSSVGPDRANLIEPERVSRKEESLSVRGTAEE